MSKKFDDVFLDACQFTGCEWHISRRAFEAFEAVDIIKRDLGYVIDITDLKPCWVRFQFASEEVREDLGISRCWMVVKEGTRNAQPTWSYREK